MNFYNIVLLVHFLFSKLEMNCLDMKKFDFTDFEIKFTDFEINLFELYKDNKLVPHLTFEFNKFNMDLDNMEPPDLIPYEVSQIHTELNKYIQNLAFAHQIMNKLVNKFNIKCVNFSCIYLNIFYFVYGLYN